MRFWFSVVQSSSSSHPSGTCGDKPNASSLAQTRPLVLKGGPHGVLLFHGLNSSPLEMQFVARGLHRAGYTVRVPILDGYTHGALRHTTPSSAAIWLEAAQSELTTFRNECQTVSVGGLCIGALLALGLAATRTNEVDALIAMSPAIHYDGWGNPWYTPFLPLAKWVPFAKQIQVQEREPFGVKDTRMRSWIAKQMSATGLSDAGASTLQVGDLLKARELAAFAQAHWGNIEAPTLLLHAVEDECATPRSSLDIAQGITKAKTQLILLHDSYHMITIDREKELVLQTIDRFISEAVTKPRAPVGVAG